MEVIFSLSIMLIVGYFFGLIAERFQLPRVTSYLIAGALFSPTLLGRFLALDLNGWSELVSHVCLGFIAYIVGSEIFLKDLRKSEKLIIIATLGQSVLSTVFVFVGFYFLSLFVKMPAHLAAVLAAIASTTAPASIVAIIQQYNAKGLATKYLLQIVALDDAIGIIIFSFIINFAFGGQIFTELGSFVHEIGLSIILGILLGFLLNYSAKLSITDDYLLSLLVGFVLLVVFLSHKYELSILLTCMTLGFTANNLKHENDGSVSFLLPIQHIEELIFIFFFTLAGSNFSPYYFLSAFGFIMLYVLLRALGKYFGVFFSTKMITGSPREITNYLGLCLLPQAGVAIGLIMQLIHRPEVAPYRHMLLNIVIGSTMVNGIAGPLLAKFSLKKTGDIRS